MAARELIFDLRQAGYTICVKTDRLLIAPASELSDKLKNIIRESKPEILAELAREDRRQKALAMLDATPGTERAIIADAHTDIDDVIITLAIKGKGSCELLIPKSKYDAFALMEIIEKHATSQVENILINQSDDL